MPFFILYFIIKNEDEKETFFKLFFVTAVFFLLIFFPFIVKSPDLFIYDVFSGHIGSVELIQRIGIMINTFLANLKDYSILALAGLLSMYVFIRLRRQFANLAEIIFLLLIFTVLFFASLFPVNNRGVHYNTLNLPILFVFIACISSKLTKKIKAVSIIILLLFFAEQIDLVKKYNLIPGGNPIGRINSAAEYILGNKGS